MADMRWSRYIRDQERAYEDSERHAAKNMLPLLAELSDYESPHEMYRSHYEYVACGPWMSLKVNGTWVHCEDLHKLGTWAEMLRRSDHVEEILFGSIVEGVDECACDIPVRMADIRSRRSKHGRVTRRSLQSAIDRAVHQVDDDASRIWNETHGCDTCKKHWAKLEGDEFNPDECELAPVWERCPDCGGHGEII